MVNLELTDEQVKHVQLLLQQDKPSRTRLTSDEKNMIIHMCSKWHEVFPTTDEDDMLLKIIINKMSK